MSKMLRPLIVEDIQEDFELMEVVLSRAGFQLASRRVDSPEDLREALQSARWDVVISDHAMPSFSALDALLIVREFDLDLPFIIVSGVIVEDQAVQAMKAGANDYLIKGNLARLAPAIERELREAEMHRARREAEAEVAASRQQLRDLAHYLQTSLEEERARISREIHDEFGQALTAIKMDLSWMAKHLPPEDVALAKRLAGALNLTDEAIHTVRRIATNLRPPLLDKMGLVAAIEWYAQEFSARNGIRCTLSLPAEEPMIEPGLATAIFRICQEALTNVSRHAQATQVSIRLENTPQQLRLWIQDNGVGLPAEPGAGKKSLGLVGMAERALSWKGMLTISGEKNAGTTVVLTVPNDSVPLDTALKPQ